MADPFELDYSGLEGTPTPVQPPATPADDFSLDYGEEDTPIPSLADSDVPEVESDETPMIGNPENEMSGPWSIPAIVAVPIRIGVTNVSAGVGAYAAAIDTMFGENDPNLSGLENYSAKWHEFQQQYGAADTLFGWDKRVKNDTEKFLDEVWEGAMHIVASAGSVVGTSVQDNYLRMRQLQNDNALLLAKVMGVGKETYTPSWFMSEDTMRHLVALQNVRDHKRGDMTAEELDPKNYSSLLATIADVGFQVAAPIAGVRATMKATGITKKTLTAAEAEALLRNKLQATTYDLRPYKDVVPDLYEMGLKKVTLEGNEIATVRNYDLKFRDLPSIVHGNKLDWHRVILNPKQLAQWFDNPVVKWAVSQVEDIKRKFEISAETILYDTQPEYRGALFKSGIHQKLVPTLVPREQSPMLMWKQLPVEAQANVGRALIYNTPQRNFRGFRAVEATDAELARGWKDPITGKEYFKPMSPQEIALYRRMRDALDISAVMYNQVINKYGLDKSLLIDVHPGYFPSIWGGDFSVTVFPKPELSLKLKNVPKVMRTGKNIWELDKEIKALKTRFPEDMYDYHVVKSTDMTSIHPEASVNAFWGAVHDVKKLRLGKPQEQALIDLLEKNFGIKGGFRAHGREKQGVGGHLGDPDFALSNELMAKQIAEAFEGYVRGASRAAATLEARAVLSRSVFADEGLAQKAPNTLGYVHEYLDQFSGHATGLDKFLASITEATGIADRFGATSFARTTQNIGSALAQVKLFMHNLTFLVPQVTQASVMVPPHLMRLKGYGLKGSVSKAYLQSAIDMALPDQEFIRVAKQASREGTFSPNFIRFLEEKEWKLTDKGVHMSWKNKAVDLARGYLIPGWIEEASRLQAFSMFYRYLRDSGIDEKLAARYAGRETAYYMTEYHRSQKPSLLAGGNSMAFTQFKTFSLNYFGQQLLHLKQIAQTGDIGPFGTAVYTQILAAGVTGMIMLPVVDKLIDGINAITGNSYPTMSEYIAANANNDIAKLLGYGAIQAATDRSIPSLVAPDATNMQQLLSFPQVKWVADISKSVWDVASMYAHTGTVSRDTWGEMMRQVLPRGAEGFIETWADTGQILPPADGRWLAHNPKYHHKGTAVRDVEELWKRILSQTKSLDEQRILQYMLYNTKRMKREDDHIGQFISNLARIYLETMQTTAWDPIYAFAEKHYGINSKDLMKLIDKEIMAQSTSISEQYLKSTKGSNYRAMRFRMSIEQMMPLLDKQLELRRQGVSNLGMPAPQQQEEPFELSYE